ncbi:MAG: deoxyribonuclease [Nitrospinaceae bacterium]|nr:MAG: deoxyribonuclease [Nitrospinaceae bacterium]
MDDGLLTPSSMISVEISRKQLKKIYLEGNYFKTLHCGCFFDKIQQVYPKMCDHGPKGTENREQRTILEWVHAVPVSTFAKSLKCWDEALCRGDGKGEGKGSRCCNVLSPKFKTREADMHNLFPAVGDEDEGPTELSGAFGGMQEYRFCRDKSTSVSSPRPGARGDIARAYFYMSRQYGVKIAEEVEDRFRKWHFEDPPDAWEEERNSFIELVQGNRNPFIDHPEWVERVRDF